MAKSTVSKSTTTAEAKPAVESPEGPQESGRLQLNMELAGERLVKLGTRLRDLSDLAYEYQRELGGSALNCGIENLLAFYAWEVSEIGERLKGDGQ